jgi:hypothetical protein
MAFLKYAKARVEKAGIQPAEWDAIRASALLPAVDFRSREAARVIINDYDPKRFLLSHCTIIASVDTEESTLPLGRQMVDGFQINRRYADYLVTPETSKFVNNNNDCWERKLLLACFKTFIGAENYVEHIQIPEMSKGKIIDAAARNVGESIYVDILVATDRKHGPIVNAITSGQLGTLSMGCSVDFTTCTKCGNVAEDETTLCPHIRYFKGSEFVDDMGRKRKIAELCGHLSAEPGSVKFIEASWVANPAFTGAVIRNILSESDVADLDVGKRLQFAFSQPARVSDADNFAKAARTTPYRDMGFRVAQDQFDGIGDLPGAKRGTQETPKTDPLDKTVNDLAAILKDKAIEHVRGEINKDEAGKARQVVDENRENESLIKSALLMPEWQRIARVVYAQTNDPKRARHLFKGLVLQKRGGWNALRHAGNFTGRDVLAVSRFIDLLSKRASMAGEARVYRTVIALGGTAPYGDVETYLAACRRIVGRSLTGSEAGALIEKGRLFSLGSS